MSGEALAVTFGESKERVASERVIEETADRIDALLAALPETIELLAQGREGNERQTAAYERAVGAREFAEGVRQDYESMRESLGDTLKSRDEHKAVQLMAQFETLAKALAEAYGAAADIESTTPSDLQERVQRTLNSVMEGIADIGNVGSPE